MGLLPVGFVLSVVLVFAIVLPFVRCIDDKSIGVAWRVGLSMLLLFAAVTSDPIEIGLLQVDQRLFGSVCMLSR